MIKKNIFITLVFTALLIPTITKANVNFCSLNNYSLKIDETTIKSGYTIEAFDNSFTIGIFPEVLEKPTRINLKNVTKLEREQGVKAEYKAPEGWQFNSDIYEYDFTQKDSYTNKEPLVVEIAFGKDTINHKQIFYFDKNLNTWNKISSTPNYNTKTIRVNLHFSYVRLAVFDQIDIAGTGKASWYNQALFKYFNYKNGDFAASQQYAKGTKLRVKNLANDKTVIVTVNDYGPEKWTGRIIDLDVSAFKKLAWKGLGVVNVSVEPVDE